MNITWGAITNVSAKTYKNTECTHECTVPYRVMYDIINISSNEANVHNQCQGANSKFHRNWPDFHCDVSRQLVP